jgi:membrane-associated phospholipid phosphatase
MVRDINYGGGNCKICDPSRMYLGIFITVLLLFGLLVVPLLQGTNAQSHLNDKVDYEMIFDNNNDGGSGGDDSTNQWEQQSSSMMTSLNRDFSEALAQNISNNNAVVSWNQMMTAIGSQKNIPAPYLARDYALMHVAIYDALLQSTNNNTANNKKSSEGAIVAGAAAEVLAYLFPENFASIAALEEQQLTHIAGHDTSQIVDGKTIGHDVAKKAIAYAETIDTSDAQLRNETAPSSSGKWSGTNPLGPSFGYEKTYILSSGTEFQPLPPYPFGSAEDVADVQAVIDAAHSRTPEQIAIVHKWAALSPATIWNNMLNERIENYNLPILESARASAYLNAAMYDSFVSCWYTKFTYWTARPFQRITDPEFTTVIPTPNFPSYTSGHSAVSSTAAVILGQLFPEEADYFLSQAQEAAASRLWAGIHFPQDNNNGFAVGQQIGREYVNDMLKPPHQFVANDVR